MPSAQIRPSSATPPPAWAVLLGLVTCALILMAVHPEAFLCLPSTSIDPWIYTGYALSLPQHWQNYPDTYYGTRVSYIFPSYLMVHKFGVVVGLRIFKVSLFVLNGWWIWGLCRRHLGSLMAVAATAAVAACPLLWPQFSWDYPTAIGGMFILGALRLLDAWQQAKTPLAAIGAGACFAMAVHTSLFVAIFLPVLVVYLVIGNLPSAWRIARGVLLWLPLGIALGTAALGLWSMQLGGHFLFFWPNFQWLAENKLSGAPNPWVLAGWAWIFSKPGVTLIFAGLLAAVLCLPRRITAWRVALADQTSRAELALTGAHLTMGAIMLAMQAKGEPIFSLSYKMVYILPFSCLQILILFLRPARTSKNPAGWPQEIGLLLLLFCIEVGLSEILLKIGGFGGLHQLIKAGGYLFGALVLLLLAWWVALRLRPLGTVLMAILLMVIITAVAFDYTVVYAEVKPRQAEQFFREVVALHREVYKFTRGTRPQFWYERTASDGSRRALYNAVTATFLWGYSIVSNDFPTFDRSPFGQTRWDLLRLDEPLFVLAEKPGDLALAQTNLRQKLGLSTKVAHLEQRRVADAAYFFAVLQADSPTVSTTPLIEWVDSTGSIDLQRNFYDSPGLNAAERICREEPDRCYLTGVTANDHLATPYARMPATHRTPCIIAVQLDFPEAPPETPSVTITLQDEHFAPLLVVHGGQDRQRLVHHVLLVHPVRELRLVVSGTPGQSQLLPRHMSVRLLPQQ